MIAYILSLLDIKTQFIPGNISIEQEKIKTGKLTSTGSESIQKPGLFSSIFGPKDEIGYIRDIDKDIHNEISFFLELEESSAEKVRLANEFVSTWNAGDLQDLRKHMKSIKSLVK